MTLGWNFWVHEEQKFVADAETYLAANPTHTITERFLDDNHPGGISYVDFTPSGSNQYMRVGTEVYCISVTGNNLTITPSGGPTVIAGDGQFLPISGGTMTGPLTLSGAPLVNLHAATKQYVDEQVAAAEGDPLAIEDDDSEVLASALRLDFGFALDVTSGAGQEAEISVDESEFLTVVFLTGAQTISGNKTFANDVDVDGILTVTGNPSTGNQVANKTYVDEQVSSAANAGKLAVEDDNAEILAEALRLDFGHALDVTSGAGQEAEIVVDESEFTTVVFLTGDQVISGNKTFANNVIMNGDLTVNGTTTTLNTTELLIEDNCITINSTVTGTPTIDACFEVERGIEPNAQLYWDETLNEWQFGISGSLETIASTTDLSSVANAGKLEVKDDNSQILVEALSLDFGHAIDVTSGTGQEAEIAVDESEFTTVLFLAGGTMTGPLTLSGNPLIDNHAATKLYVDQQVAAATGNPLAVEDDDVEILNDTLRLDFGHAIDVTSGTGQEAEISVNESEFTTVLFLSGGTMSGTLTLAADPTLSGHAANKNYVDEQVAVVQPTVQIDFTAGTDLDVTQNTLPLSGVSAVNVNGSSTYTVNATNVAINQVGYYKVSWNVEGEKNGGSTQRRILQTNLNFNGTQLNPTSAAVPVRDATNNHGSTANSYIVEVTSAAQTVGIRSRQTGNGGGSSVTFELSSGHFLIERLGDN